LYFRLKLFRLLHCVTCCFCLPGFNLNMCVLDREEPIPLDLDWSTTLWGSPDVVVPAEHHPSFAVAGAAVLAQLGVAAGALEAPGVPVPLHGEEQDPVHDAASTARTRPARRHLAAAATTATTATQGCLHPAVHHGNLKRQHRREVRRVDYLMERVKYLIFRNEKLIFLSMFVWLLVNTCLTICYQAQQRGLRAGMSVFKLERLVCTSLETIIKQTKRNISLNVSH